jgi:hypothetical protein
MEFCGRILRARPADLLEVRPSFPRELQGLCMVARGHDDRMSELLEAARDGREQERVGRV